MLYPLNLFHQTFRKIFIDEIISFGSFESISKSIESMSANLLNKTAFPSITGLDAKAPRFLDRGLLNHY